MMMRICLLLAAASSCSGARVFREGKAYENNPFLNGQTIPAVRPDLSGVISPAAVAVIPIESTHTPPTAVIPNNNVQSNNLYRYCLEPNGQFQGTHCNTFAVCWDGYVVEQYCPQTLVFNPKGYCDYPQNVDCGVKTIAALPTHVSDDGKYKPQETSSTQSSPISSSEATTTTSTTTSTTTTTTTPPPIIFVQTESSSVATSTSAPIALPVGDTYGLRKLCLQPRGQFSGSLCSKYVDCWDGVVVEQDCPPGLIFNPFTKYCDYSYNYPCKDHNVPSLVGVVTEVPVPAVTSVATAVPIQPTNIPSIIMPVVNPQLRKLCLQERGQFAGTECNKYVNCWDDVVIEQDCPEGLYFNANKGYCDYSNEMACVQAKDKPQTNKGTVPETIRQSKACPLSQGTFRNKDDCVNYFTCIDGKIVAKYQCPTGYLFNDVIGVCDLQYRVDCSREPYIFYPTRRSNNNLLPEAVVNPAVSCQPGTLFRLNNDCSHVAICRNSVTEIVQCPSGLSYDIVTDKCVEPKLAKC